MDTNRYNRDDYEKTLIAFLSEEDRYDCLRLLTNDNLHNYICRDTYIEKHLQTIIDSSSHFLCYRLKTDGKPIVGFALLKVRNLILDILLLCAIPNKDEIGTMVAFGVYNVAISKHCRRIVVAPRTPALRETFIRHGYTICHGIKDIDEVLERPVLVPTYSRTTTTRKQKSIRPSSTVYPNNQYDCMENIPFVAGGYTVTPNSRKSRIRKDRFYSLKYRRQT